VRVIFDVAPGIERSFSGAVTMTTFGSEQYVWRSEGPASRPDPDLPPVKTTVQATPGYTFTLPKASLNVLQGKLQDASKIK